MMHAKKPQHFAASERRAGDGVRAAAGRVAATALMAGLAVQPLLSPLSAFAATQANDGQGSMEAPLAQTAVAAAEAGGNAAAKSTAELASESAKALEEAKAAYDVAQKQTDSAQQAQQTAQANKDQASQAARENAAEQVAAAQEALDEKTRELADAIQKAADHTKQLEDLTTKLDQAKKDQADCQAALDDAQSSRGEAQKAFDAAQAALDAMDMKGYEQAKADVAAAQKALDEANAKVDSAKAALDEATSAVLAAETAAAGAKDQVSAAEEKKSQAADTLAAAAQKRNAAKDAYDKAQAAFDAAASGEGIDLDALQKEKDAAQAALDAAQTAYGTACADDEAAKGDLASARDKAADAQTKADDAHAALESTQASYDDVKADHDKASAACDSAKKAYGQASQAELDKRAEYEKLAAVRDQKKSAYDAACADAKAAKDDYDAANTEVDGLNQQIAELKSNMTVDQDVIDAGIVGFMNYIKDSDGFTAAQKANAAAAVSMLTGASDKAQWYDAYVDQNKGRDTNPLSLEQMRNALTYLDTHNNLRKANGLPELSISLRMTAAAALNASYSSNNWGHSNCYSDNGENLADGGGAYTGGETEGTLGWPYSGLYTQEKEAFDRYVEQYGDALGSHRYDSFYIYQNYNSIYQECSHYLNIIDNDMKAFGVAVGCGKNTDSEVTVFDYSDSGDQADFTVSEFKKLLNDYIDAAYTGGGTQTQKE